MASVSDLKNEMRSHEVSIAELNALPSSRTVYQKNGNLFFRTTAQTAANMEQKQLDSAKAKLKNLNSSV
uniref:Prefoldin n=1 Tax=Medicago truncatula TaxID=3880 RepID=I3S0Q2_MEDTR|nr:unknown [Medicago truncatula]